MKLRLNTSRFKKPKKIITVFVFVLLFLVGAGLIFNSVDFLDNKATSVFSYVQAPFSYMNGKIAGFWYFMTSLQNINNENLSLRNDNLKLLSEAAQVLELKQENDFLRASLDLEPKEPLKFLVARVVGQEVSGLSNVIFIDKGREEGIKEGMAVVLTERILVGVVIEVKDNIAYVRLLTDPEMSLAAITIETQTEGLLRGNFGHTLIMDEIVKDNLVFLDELVLSSGKDGRFPANFITGRVRSIKFSESGLFKQAIVEPVVDLNKLYQVLVVVSS